ncbi:30S ribosomal protein S7e [Mucor mucedo]|uniref:30S ribosomal protein S7e n=1 Tax=Mucor mucedo TaxID=29922 RepID=UPI00221EEFB1|nr:30S ribosomal protein S7e [Mucor mucedo]KAI7893115.1 30S ribosomal protein S7e [Mucor mucedo]
MSLKIVKLGGVQPDELELTVAQALVDLESSVPESRFVTITAAKEIELGGGKKAIVVFVPAPIQKAVQKVQTKLTRELEKKFSDRHIVFVAQRRILAVPTRRNTGKQPRPRSRTLTAVHDAILDDLVFPTEIIGKRLRQKVDGSKTLKVFLDTKDATSLEYKIDSFSAIYKKLTGKDVTFEFPAAVEF